MSLNYDDNVNFVYSNIDNFRNVFDITDSDGDGFISLQEFNDLLTSLNIYYDKVDLEILDQNEKINFDSFINLTQNLTERKKINQGLTSAFSAFDKEKTGKISIANLVNILKNHDGFTEEEIEEILKEVYQDDGIIEYKKLF